MHRNLLLISSSYVSGSGYLDNFIDPIREFLADIKEIIFVPFAADESQWDTYTAKVKDRFAGLEIDVIGIHKSDINKLGTTYKAIFIGGGNTFRLLFQLQQQGMMKTIRDAVLNNEVRYIGSSAGSNLSCKTICTTNDMPIIYPQKGFDALNLIPFQINPHYIDPDPGSAHMGETREQRINEFHESNDIPVIGLREGAYLRIDDAYYPSGDIYLGGTNGAKIFFKGKIPIDLTANGNFSITDLQKLI